MSKMSKYGNYVVEINFHLKRIKIIGGRKSNERQWYFHENAICKICLRVAKKKVMKILLSKPNEKVQ